MIFCVSTGAARSSGQNRDHVAELRALLLASQRFRQAIADHFHLSLREVVVVGHLADAAGGLTPREIAERMLIGSGTLTAILDRLVADGYARREPNPRDRRSSIVSLTRSGERLVRHVNEQLELVIAAATADDAPTARPGLQLVRLAAALDDLAGRHVGRPRRERPLS
jgi:DNA-binding MarR family transcriptional regulator